MQSATTARSNSQATLTGLTYIDSLVSGATLMGLYTITVENSSMNSSMATTLRSLGYNVSVYETRDLAGQLYPRYVISWAP